MLTEIYDERELNPTTLQVEPDAEALALINELGLVRQMKDGKRITYPQVSADQAFIMEQLFPQATKLAEYDAGTIPLRVLKEIRSYTAEFPTHRLVVRHCAPAQVKDPILLAWTGDTSHEWAWMQSIPQSNGGWTSFRMIARWGDALEPWADLLKAAVDRATQQWRQDLLKAQSEIELRLAALAKGFMASRSSRAFLHTTE